MEIPCDDWALRFKGIAELPNFIATPWDCAAFSLDLSRFRVNIE